MKISYSKDYKHNYLVIEEENDTEESYQVKMMTQNKLQNILSCQERMINGQTFLYYEVTSKQPVINYFSNKLIRIDDIRNILLSLKVALNELSKYILYGRELILSPEYIFWNMDSETYSFLYYPFYECEEDNNIKKLTDYLIEHIDNEDMETVEAVYQLADIVSQQHYALDEAVAWFLDEFADEPEEVQGSIEADDEILVEDVPEEPDNNKRKEKPWYMRIWDMFFGEEDEGDYWLNLENSMMGSEEKSMSKIPVTEDDATVFIPWIENCEHKLYGVGKNNKNHIDLSKAPLVIGKMSNSVDMTISDSSISRMHAKFFRQGNKYFLTDLNSTNGSFKNGLRLNPNQTVQIEPGDEIGLGKLKFIYR